MIRKVLVANRGEIALRVIRACRELGIKVVTIHSEADKKCLHRKFGDADVCVGPGPARESYLNIPRIISAALITGADAIHPGYGFLAENPQFAEVCKKHKIKFIGPSPENMKLMGDKATARKIAQKAGVPVVPGTEDVVSGLAEAKKEAKRIGYPVILKATAGGGGKGMRIVRNEKELEELYPIAEAEAKSAFNNPALYIEKYIQRPRHVEFQILADKHGNVIHLGERDCSIQRRHQKLIEESPSPILDEDLRQRMGEAAVKLAREIGYESAGTIEFLVDNDKNFYFMEMNTRIQVEHPITEERTRINLVKEQILIAGGEKLHYKQDKIFFIGHSIECRINAEDPYHDFVPSPGKIEDLHFPGGLGVRIESHLYAGYEIPPYYDSLLAKIVVWGMDREEARKRMLRALDEVVITGVPHLVPFHKAVLSSRQFIKGDFDTHFLDSFKLK